MKKQLIIMAILCAIALTSNAQTEKGQNLIGGAIGFSSNKETQPANTNGSNNRTTSFSISPRYGHFFAKNLAIGIVAGYINNKTTYDYTQTTANTVLSQDYIKTHEFNVGPYLRYYVDIVDKFKFYGQFNASIGFGKGNNTYSPINVQLSTIDTKLNSYNVGITPGFAFFPAKRWAIEFSFPLVAYNKQTTKYQVSNSELKYTSEAFSSGISSFNPSIGLNFHF